MSNPASPDVTELEYHQILRLGRYHWWKSAVGIVLALLGFVLVWLLFVPILLIGAMSRPGGVAENFTEMITLENPTAEGLLFLNLSLGGSILVAWFVIRAVHGGRPAWLSSVNPGIRWGLLWRCVPYAALALVAQLALSFLLPESEGGGGDELSLNSMTATLAWMLLVMALTTPLQAAGEEYIFRGYMLQAIGSLARPAVMRWVAIVVTALIFAAFHGAQNFPLFFDRFMFGVVAGWLTIRTGGLEAGIALHVVNNYFALTFAILFGDLGEALTISEASWWNVPLTLGQAVLYTALIVRLTGRYPVQRTVTRQRPDYAVNR